MAEAGSKAEKGLFWATVRSNRRFGQSFYRMNLQFEGAGAKAFAKAQPGQFMEMSVETTSVPPPANIPSWLSEQAHKHILLRRPFSFCDVSVKGDKTFVDVLYKVVGPASLRMTTLVGGDYVNIIGPLGKGFLVPQGKKLAYLVVGGMGSPPIEHLAKVLNTEYPAVEPVVFAGARVAAELPFERRLDAISQDLGFAVAEFAKYGIRSYIATDDGSVGYMGLVTTHLAEEIEKREANGRETIIYACGPTPMLAGVAHIAAEHNIDCQVSMEEMMACGIGVCQGCAIECKTGDGDKTVYKLCCQDGPVFDSREIVFKH